MAVDRVLVEKHVRVPMRDGVVLRADVYRPADAADPGRAVPGVVTRTPYDKEQSGGGLVTVVPSALKLAERGYAVVVCDTRGRYASQGDFQPFHQEIDDGYDTIEWTAAQDWCNGDTAVYGPLLCRRHHDAGGALPASVAALRCPHHHRRRLLRRLDLPRRRIPAGLHRPLGLRPGGDRLPPARAQASASGRRGNHAGPDRQRFPSVGIAPPGGHARHRHGGSRSLLARLAAA